MKDSHFLLRLEPDVKKRIKVLSATLDTTMTALINQLILDRLEKEKEQSQKATRQNAGDS